MLMSFVESIGALEERAKKSFSLHSKQPTSSTVEQEILSWKQVHQLREELTTPALTL
jgi:hypothetical protein